MASGVPAGAAAADVGAAPKRNLIAEHLPRVEYLGGPFVRRPRIVTVTYAGDDAALVTRLERFGDTITRTAWWRTVSEGYCAKAGDCIGEGRPGLAVRLDEMLPADVHAVELSELLIAHAKAGRFGTIDADTLLLVHLPKGVTLRDAFVPRYCDGGRRAVHRALRFDDRTLGFALVPRCGDEAALTATASHEILEVATNPDPARRGFAFVPQSATYGFTTAGVEPVDPCGLILRGKNHATESGFTVQRAWSNRAAAEGRDPCVPSVRDAPYVALVPEQPVVRLTRAGARVTVPLVAAANGTVPPWKIAALDFTGAQEAMRYVDVALDRPRIKAGEQATLTITLRKRHPKELSVVGLVSTVGSVSYLWPLAVSYGQPR